MRARRRSGQELLGLENHWLQVEDNPGALESTLAPEFLHAVPIEIITKQGHLSSMRKHPAQTKDLLAVRRYSL
jgi:hypothetical protein